ncbi:MAG TPA: DUF5715 family protein [Pyrinomonadaceae bacterium]|nr:DUF5715 family protein [Pyrinomonadaceae bacterium]
MQAKLIIEGPYETRTETVADELSVGRTALADIELDDAGLSKVNTTFFVDDGYLWVADEDSTNGTFLNGERVAGRPQRLKNGDRITLGSTTSISVEITDGREEPVWKETPEEVSAPTPRVDVGDPTVVAPIAPIQFDDEGQRPHVYFALAGVMTVVMLLFGGIAYLLVLQGHSGGEQRRQTASSVIPVRVIDPLGGESDEDLNDILAAWEVAEDELVASDLDDTKVDSSVSEEQDLNVSAAFLADRQRLATEGRPPIHIRPAGLNVPRELFGDGVIKQTRKLREMRESGYQQPMDFADLAQKRLSGELIEMPMARESFYLDVGGSAQDVPFTSFEFGSPSDRREPIVPGHPKYPQLKQLADSFAGQKYDLNDPADRRQMRRRLLRMFHPNARPILQEIADSYFQRFRRPLRVTSLTRSMDYQILLTQGNANAYKVRGAGALPPHTSGCAFDLARKHMPAEEQNFLMEKLAEMERANKIDALIEYGVNACFHIFIYHDGKPPRASKFYESDYDRFPFLTGIAFREPDLHP